MRLYLVQHGPAKSKDEDPDRPLTEAGEDVVRRVARRLGESGAVAVEGILQSGKTRARRTAEILAEALHPPAGVRAVEELGPVDDPGLWVERLPELETEFGEGGVMLVGHLPFMERMAALLLSGDAEETVVRFQQGGVLCLEREGGSWVVAWYLAPELV